QARTADTQIHGLESLLNVWGYFVELDDDANLRPTVLSANSSTVPLRVRFRLMEMMAPAEKMKTYQYTSGMSGGAGPQPNSKNYKGKDWYQAIVNSAQPNTHVLAENIVALVLHPEVSSQDRAALIKANGSSGAELAKNYLYDTTQTNANSNLDTKDQ